jgi:hypothetical protein
MEDTLALILVMVGVVAGGIALFYFIRNMRKRRAEIEAAELAKRKQVEDYWAKKAAERAKVAAVNSVPISRGQVPPKPAPKPIRVTSTPAPAPSPSYVPPVTQEVSNYSRTSDILDTVADVAMIAHTVRHWNDNETKTTEPERSVGVSKSESSWGFDDDDSRKSVSSSFSSSWSSDSSSSSSDSWSSSDSGPSSDW